MCNHRKVEKSGFGQPACLSVCVSVCLAVVFLRALTGVSVKTDRGETVSTMLCYEFWF